MNLLPDRFSESNGLRGDNGTAKPTEQFVTVKETEDVIRGLIAEAVSAVRIDVVHHKRDILLGVKAKVLSLGDEAADEFMISFTGSFLVRRGRVTIKEMSPTYTVRPEFDCRWIGEFRAIIGQKNIEETVEGISPEGAAERFKDIRYRTGIIEIPKECKHHLTLCEMNRQQDLAALDPFH